MSSNGLVSMLIFIMAGTKNRKVEKNVVYHALEEKITVIQPQPAPSGANRGLLNCLIVVLILAFLPAALFTLVLFGGIGGCGAMLGSFTKFSTLIYTSDKGYPLPTWQGGVINVGRQYSSCRLETVTITRKNRSTDDDGQCRCTYKISLTVRNDTPRKQAPRLQTRLWNSSRSDYADKYIAYSWRRNLKPGAAKTFTETVRTPFDVAAISIKER